MHASVGKLIVSRGIASTGGHAHDFLGGPDSCFAFVQSTADVPRPIFRELMSRCHRRTFVVCISDHLAHGVHSNWMSEWCGLRDLGVKSEQHSYLFGRTPSKQQLEAISNEYNFQWKLMSPVASLSCTSFSLFCVGWLWPARASPNWQKDQGCPLAVGCSMCSVSHV